MRIIGYIPHPLAKITVFHLNMKYVIKMEMGLYEQTFKIRESDHMNSFDAVAALVNEQFIEEAIARFDAMNKSLSDSFKDQSS